VAREGSNQQNVVQRLGSRGIAAIGLVVLAIIFIVENTRRARIRFIIPQVNAPVWLALLVAAALGALAGALLMHRRTK
jgi:uncharacterized integral membrane protein